LESLLVAESLIKCWTNTVSTPEEVANEIYSWVLRSIIPSPKYAKYYEQAYIADGEYAECVNDLKLWGSVDSNIWIDKTKLSCLDKFKTSQLEATTGISVLGYLNKIFPIRGARDSVFIIATLAAFTCEKDPWTTPEAYTKALTILAEIVPCITTEKDSLAALLRDIHEQEIKPIFSNSNNPALTSTGRKNFFPPSQPRFDRSLFDPESKPWKSESVYVITVLSWVLSQYPVCWLCLFMLSENMLVFL
jgi:hypothetical protein